MIKLVDAAEHFKNLPHQRDALEWLQTKISASVLEEFAVKYRNNPKPELEFSNTWEGVLAAAKKAGAKFPECVAAQWYLESAQGKHLSCTHNYFGIKSKDGEGCYVSTQEVYGGQKVTIKDWFKAFDTLYDCVDYLVTRWYKDYKGYKGVNRATSRNECARLLKEEGYATDTEYSTKLIQIMDRMTGTPGGAEKPKFNPWSPFTYKITPNITYGELTLNQEARRFTKQYQCNTALELCQFLEKVRSAFGNKPLIITSASRPEPINTQVGGAKNSEHTYNAPSKGAVDFYIEGVDVYKVQVWCDKNWPYSVGYGAPKGFVHLGIREGKPRVRWDY
jgi:hypothetical protein